MRSARAPQEQRDAPISYRLPAARGRVLGRPDPLVWPALLLALVAGVVVCWLAAEHPGRAAASYAVTVAIVVVCFSVASVNVRMANRISPSMAMAAAMFSYVATVGLMLILFLAANPRTVDTGAVLGGACVAVVVWLAALTRASWVR